ncbi:aromatic ring-hydroxylating dioxygenase subunit alpha [Hydrogenophaga sp.]|uniref:aromatic ring-hydroxylating dioxygenase subunit alpha n=1 Tax=Hydrogenophaga sp. TaxID=1904254 RepID=UPI003F6FF515
MTTFIRNAWYVAAWSKDIGRSLTARRILGEPVVLYRKEDGAPAALLDRCAHKLLPLSMGRIIGNVVQCGYHGMEYDCTGKCVRIPGQDVVPPKAVVRSFPVVERYDAVWIWMGDAALADEALIHRIERHGVPGWAVIDGQYQHHRTNYVIIAENLQDPAHTTYAHRSTIGNPAASEVPVKVEQKGNHVVSWRWTNSVPPPPIDRDLGGFTGLVDRCQYYNYFAPCVSRVDVVTMRDGLDHTEENMDLGQRAFSYKFLTPETEGTTHFFWMHVRNFGVGNAELEASLIEGMNRTFEEDNVICGAIQLEQVATGIRQHTFLAIDAGPARVRRVLEQMAANEIPTTQSKTEIS